MAAQLVQQLRAASDAYYNGGTLLMSDETYDGLIERLRELEPSHPYFEEVGAPVEGAVKLPYAMPSLDKIKPGEKQLERFLKTPGGFVVSEKLDGLSALWTKGKLYLRGNGIEGQDVTHLVALGLKGLRPCPLAVRGELILPRHEGVALARSWVNGQIHQTKPTEVGKIHFVAYEVKAVLKRSDQFAFLQNRGFEIPWWATYAKLAEADLATLLQTRRDSSPYDTDGLVVGLDCFPKSESSAMEAVTKAKNPKDCVAFKMPLADQSATTTVRAVLWAPSAQGYIIPRIQFEPVKIGSATIEFCTGHNARMILTNKVGPGAKIIVRRSGDVIPKLDTVLVPAEPSFPSEGWAWDGDEATATHIKQVTPNSAMMVARLQHFLKTLDIPGIGPAAVKSLVEANITGPASLLACSTERLSEILGPKTGAGLYTNVRAALQKTTEMVLMVASSTMPRGVGETKLTSLFALEADPRKWTAALSPGGWTAESYTSFLSQMANYVEWRSTELPTISYPILSTIKTVAVEKLVCITGFRDSELEKAVAKRGYKLVSVFTGRVSILLVPDGPVKETDKVKAAREKNLPILSRSQFVAQYLA